MGVPIGLNGFLWLVATREWLWLRHGDRFVRAYTKTQAYIIDIPAAEIARTEKEYFPNIVEEVLEKCIKTFQALGCWMPHIEITEAGYQETLDIYQYNGLINERLYV